MINLENTPDIEFSKLITGKSTHSRSHSHRQQVSSVFWQNSQPSKPKHKVIHHSSKAVHDTLGCQSGVLDERIYAPPDKSKYTVKYIGVTNGQIGILSTKRPIPKMSYIDACPRTPLPMIYASVSRKQIASPASKANFLKQELSFIEDKARDRLQHKRNHYATHDPALSSQDNDYMIHKYSFPRGLISIKKQRESDLDSLRKEKQQEETRKQSPEYMHFALRFDLEKHKRLSTPKMRRGMSGWMLSGYKLEEQPVLHRIVRHRSRDRTEGTSEISGDLYLKYLQLKLSLQKDTAEKTRSKSGT